MFKRGEIVTSNKTGSVWLVASDDKVITIHSTYGEYGEESPFSQDGNTFDPYTGPTYEKNGRRFVPSGEFRVPKQDEWFATWPDEAPLLSSGYDDNPSISHHGCRPILLPVPALPEEVEERVKCDFCDGKGELLTICERCHGTGELTKPDGICPTCKGGIL